MRFFKKYFELFVIELESDVPSVWFLVDLFIGIPIVVLLVENGFSLWYGLIPILILCWGSRKLIVKDKEYHSPTTVDLTSVYNKAEEEYGCNPYILHWSECVNWSKYLSCGYTHCKINGVLYRLTATGCVKD